MKEKRPKKNLTKVETLKEKTHSPWNWVTFLINLIYLLYGEKKNLITTQLTGQS